MSQKKITTILNNNRIALIFLILFSLSIFLISYIPNFYEISLTPLVAPDRIMLPGEHVYTYDYNVYLSKILQGIEGRFSVVDKYDNNPQAQGAFLQMLYVLSGRFGGLLGLNQVIIFHSLRTILSLIWALLIVYVNKFFLKKPIFYIPATIISLLAGSYPVFYEFEGATWIGSHMSWWQELDVSRRASYLPHYTFNYIALTVMTILLAKFSHTENKKIFNTICIILFISFFVHPTGGLIFLLSWVFYHLLKNTWEKKWDNKEFIKFVKNTVILVIVSLIPLLYIRYVTFQYPWKSLVDFDINNPAPFNLKDYTLALGPVALFGFLGLLTVLIQRNIKLLPIATWIIGVFAGIFLFRYFPDQSPLRFVQAANHIPLAILSVWFLASLVKNYNNKLTKSISILIISLIVVLGVLHTRFSLKAQMHFIHQRAVATLPLVPYPSQVMYPLKDWWGAIEWLAQNTKNSDIVLGKITTGNYIPAYAGNFVYLGHNPETPQFWEREGKLNQFYTGQMSDKDALEFIKQGKIKYIFYGPLEKDKAVENISKYKFLRPVYETYHVTIFEVAK